MRYCFECFYQSEVGKPHEKVSMGELRELIGNPLADRVLLKATERAEQNSTPEANAFFERGGRQVIVADLTSRGNVYIEIVEIERDQVKEQNVEINIKAKPKEIAALIVAIRERREEADVNNIMNLIRQGMVKSCEVNQSAATHDMLEED